MNPEAPNVTLATAQGDEVSMTAATYRALMAWPNLDLSRLLTDGDDVRVHRKSTGALHPLTLEALANLVEPLQAPTAAARVPNPTPTDAEVPQGEPALLQHAVLTKEQMRAREPLHCHDTGTARIPVINPGRLDLWATVELHALDNVLKPANVWLRHFETRGRKGHEVVCGRVRGTNAFVPIKEVLMTPVAGEQVVATAGEFVLLREKLRVVAASTASESAKKAAATRVSNRDAAFIAAHGLPKTGEPRGALAAYLANPGARIHTAYR